MKKNLLAVLLPVVAGVALSGTGFGLWVFNEDVASKTIGASMQVEPAINFTSTALSIKSLSVTNANGKVVGATENTNKTIVFDQSDALKSGVRWTVNIEVGVTYTALLGTLHPETNGAGTYDTASDVKAYKLEELKAALKLYQVTVYSPLSGTKGDATCDIKSYLTSSEDLTVNLENFTGIPTKDGNFDHDLATTEITKIFTFTFTPKPDYTGINTAEKYNTFRDKVKGSTFKFTAEFAKAPSTTQA